MVKFEFRQKKTIWNCLVISFGTTLYEIALTFFQRSKQEDKLNEAVTKFTEDQKKSVAETERAALLQRQELIREREKKI